MDKKVLASLLAAASVAGAGVARIAPDLLNPYRIHEVRIYLDNTGAPHRTVSAHRNSPADGVVGGTCDDAKADARLRAEVASAETECAFK